LTSRECAAEEQRVDDPMQVLRDRTLLRARRLAELLLERADRREDLLGRARTDCPSVFDYSVQAKAGSMYNTPATFAIYLAGLTFEWLLAQGGIAEIERRNIAKAKLLYDCLDRSAFYLSPVRKEDRSRMNVPFKLSDASLDESFLQGAKERGMVQLKGHRAVGGMRASIYNAMPIEGVQALVGYLADFERRHG